MSKLAYHLIVEAQSSCPFEVRQNIYSLVYIGRPPYSCINIAYFANSYLTIIMVSLWMGNDRRQPL